MKIKKQGRRFAENQNGNVAMIFSIAALPIILLVGGGLDYSMTSSAQNQSQDIADAIALNAAVQVRASEVIPTAGSSEGIAPGKHKVSDFGYQYEGWVKGGADSTMVKVAYDRTAQDVTVTVEGRTVASFAKMLGIDSMNFSAQSVASFERSSGDEVASLALVLDNSGSMAWDDKPYVVGSSGSMSAPSGTTPRITALESSVTALVDHIDGLIGPQNGHNAKVFRMGMLAYNSGIITGRTRSMQWSLLNNGNITSMRADGGTNSSSAMLQAKSWMMGEDAVHKAQNGKSPLRYVIFMTDGVNNNNGSAWRAKSGTGYWRTTYDAKYSYNNTWYQQSGHEYHTGNSPPATWNSGWQYSRQGNYRINYRADGWEEGEWSSPDDEATLASCQSMKNAGVKIYTIGFGLAPGTYGTNERVREWWSGKWVDGTTRISSSETDHAYGFLAACASDDTTFMTASSASELKAVFDSIGNDIADDAIRIKS